MSEEVFYKVYVLIDDTKEGIDKIGNVMVDSNIQDASQHFKVGLLQLALERETKILNDQKKGVS